MLITNYKMEFPLYDELVKRSATETPSQSVWNYIMNLPSEPTEMLFALIWHHAALHNALPTQSRTAKKFALPYQAKLFEGGKGVVFRLEDIPQDLKALLSLYVASVIQG
jgi:hypothetical protein